MKHVHTVLLTTICVLLFVLIVNPPKEGLKILQIDNTPVDCKNFDRIQSTKIFYDIGIKANTDKVNPHAYHPVYGLYLGPIRYQKLNVLEIGLGCNMAYGPGKSILVWKEYLPNSNISILEYDAKCAEKFRKDVTNLYTGDQSDFNVLKKVGEGGLYDIIVDDGGHTRKQQINSLIGLWPYVKPNGIYVLEDMQTTFDPGYNDYPLSNSFEYTAKIIEILLNSWFPTPNATQEQLDIASTLLSVNCFREVCVFSKK